jgi:hypothetical protein
MSQRMKNEDTGFMFWKRVGEARGNAATARLASYGQNLEKTEYLVKFKIRIKVKEAH